ncbi:MMPL family transporter [Sporosarcina pasteurii]|uniref:Membrane protein ydgH n=1 Tax=Sporosarcina pasteurii TaxID=1474 RepID=A0A380CHT8_SPOPA|nr:MMPL family transporter [Sporosarcina pasteurii]MDS9472089.1 MMPL family transporter [Sporosarcina pasteurii]QBQ06810.1 MMPL family transporter [Sporosarcina pasteurii]SUJ20822.1 Putative membrane protein ydgH [Sporosarcina pasteurii]
MRTLANFITRAHKAIIIAWLVIFAFMAVFAIRLPSMLEGDGFRMDGDHADVMNIVSDTFDMPVETMFVVFNDVTDKKIETTIDKIEKLKLTSSIESPLNDDALQSGNVAYAMLHFDGDADNMPEVVTDIREAIGDEKGITLTGSSAISKDINEASQRDLITAEAIGLPIAILVLLFAFGTVVASLVPLMIGIVTVVSSFGILTILGGQIDLSIFILNIIPMLGLALSIDFALLFISRYREERAHSSILEAVHMTIRTAGRSVIFSAFCVFIGLGAMLLIQVDLFQNIAIGGMIVVSMAVLSSITLLPAALIALGDRIDKWRIIKVNENGANRWRKFANQVIKRPVVITILATVLLAIAMIPVKNIELTIPQIDSLPESYDSREAFELMEDTFNLTDTSTVYVIADRKDGWKDEDGLQAIKELEETLANDSLVDKVTTIFTASEISTVDQWNQAMMVPEMEANLAPLLETFVQNEKLMIPVTLAAEGASDTAQEWVREWSDKKTDWNLKIGGQPKFNQEIFDEIWDKIGLVLAVIIVSTFFILMIAFRSLLIPIKAILMNVIGLAATFGILVYIFQYGHFGIPASTIALIIPVLVFSLVFGLSMDYEVFLISRMQEEYATSFSNDKATVEGLATTSKVITSAALIMIVLTGAFAFTDVLPVKQIGVGIAIAVAIDATIIRLLLVPSLMKLFGKWNWWLPFGKGLYRSDNRRFERRN